MQDLNILWIKDTKKVTRIQRLFKFERIFCPPDLFISDSKISFKLIQKFICPPINAIPSITNYLDLLAKFGSINNNHSIPNCFCSNCQKIILSNRKKIISKEKNSQNQFLIQGFFDQNCLNSTRGRIQFNDRSIAEYYDDLQSNQISFKTLSGSSNIRIESGNTMIQNFVGSLKKIDELEIIRYLILMINLINKRFGNYLCKKCIKHCYSHIHLYGGSFKNHILTKSELKQLIKEENRKDLNNIINAMKSRSLLKYFSLIESWKS
jgi:hypothetical protein